MPRSTREGALLPLVMASAALVLVAPVVGRAGWERMADVCMGAAATAGLLSFGIAARHTFRAGRRGAAGRSGRRLT